ncbi:MAG: RDD family protein [Bdellovibrionia bacterium]
MQQQGEKGKKGIDFKPITQGLGFHPFSDGLPYAPVSKTAARPQATPHAPSREMASGAGAVSGGKADFVYPAPRVNVPVAAPVTPKASAKPQVQTQKPVAARTAKAPAKQTTTATPTAQAFGEPTFGYVYLFKRVLAYILDTTLNTSLLATGLSFALLNEDMNPDLLMNPGIVMISILFFTLFNWALVTAQEIAFGTTIGKRIFGLMIQGSTSAIFLRAFFFLPSLGFCGVGLLWSLFDKRKRCWHDVVVNVQPIEVARL